MTDTHAATASDSKADASERAGGAEAVVSGAGAGASAGASSGSTGSGADAKAAGRATVPADGGRPGGSSSGPSADGGPKFVRAPGMQPPPDSLTVPVQTPAAVKGTATVTSSVPIGGVPVETPASAPPAVARASVRVPGNTVGAATSAATTGVLGLRGTRPEDSASGPNSTGSARVSEAVRAARKTVSAAAGRGPRRARLHLKRIDPWSVMKFSFAVSFVLFVVVIVATSVLYLALDAMGVFESVNKTLTQLVGATGSDSGGSSFRITAKGVIGGAALLGLVNVVLFTALATLGAFIYNVCADLVGGIELTLAEKE